MEKKQRKHIEKEKNDIISMKLIKDSLENSPFGRYLKIINFSNFSNFK